MKRWLIALLLFIPVAMFLNYLGKPDPAEYAQDKKEKTKNEFKGVVIEKFHQRGDRLSILIENKKILEINNPSDSLYNIAIIGDTIIKTPNSNTCSIKRPNTTIQCDCYYFRTFDK